MYDDRGLTVGAIIGKRKNEFFYTISYARKTLTYSKKIYTIRDIEFSVVVYRFEKYKDNLMYQCFCAWWLFCSNTLNGNEQNKANTNFVGASPSKIYFEVRYKNASENAVVDHLSRLQVDV